MKRILVAVLDWGLGHASRCVPVIRLILQQGHEPVIASSGAALKLLRAEFPELISIELPGYAPAYPVTASGMMWTMARQIPKFISVISREEKETKRIVADHHIHAIISDNRYGCHVDHLPCALITHQSNIMMPQRFGWLAAPVRRLNESLMSKFTVCWIPSVPSIDSFAGELTSFGRFKRKLNIEYVGLLSRFTFKHNQSPQYKLLAILSGPEPQRSLLEKLVTEQIQQSGLSHFIVRGTFDQASASPHQADFLTSSALEVKIVDAEIVIARSGYSTVMDLAALQKKAIFIPTPGQTEQEYLATRLKDMKIAYSEEQSSFRLLRALQESEKYSGFPADFMREDRLPHAFTKLVS